ncbi:N-acetyltransferase family protein [Paenibacillus phoenicis]|uniref:GNAT family N-acetyltransferase n=1 Tax=Paenibacillus phoenicis TaxID=554117 RepID=UPI003D2951EC
MIIVRPYSFSDIEALTELMTDLGTPSSIEDMKKRMEIIDATPGYFTFVASKDDIVVGMIGIRIQQSYVSNDLKTQIAALVTKKQYQGQGVGKALISFP